VKGLNRILPRAQGKAGRERPQEAGEGTNLVNGVPRSTDKRMPGNRFSWVGGIVT